MPPNRDRFISATALAYAILASLWIFLSDHLLSAITNVDEVVWLSMAKGLVFITWSTALFYFALQRVPSKSAVPLAESTQQTAARHEASFFRGQKPLIYGFAFAASLVTLWMHARLGRYQHEPLLLLSMSPIILSALLGGVGPGLVATATSAAGIMYLGTESIGQLRFDNVSELFHWLLLIVNGVLVSVLSEKLHRGHRELEEHRAQLSNSQEQLKALSDHLPNGMVYQIISEADGSRRFVYVSAGIEQVSGISVQDALLDYGILFRLIIAEDVPAFRAAQETALHSLSTLNRVVRILKPDGQLRFVRINSRPRKLPDGRILWDGIAIDVTENELNQAELRKLNMELEQRVAERTAALTQANKSLESFSHIVAHDLRAPLRQLEGFASMLKHGHAGLLDDEGRQLLNNIIDSREAMSNLIEGMLAVSQLEHARLDRSATDLSALATQTARRLLEAEPHRKVTFIIQPALTAAVDRTLIQNVFDNLLGNAWKFTAGHRQARIEFGAIDSLGKRVYFVRDDGAGFDPGSGDKLFGLFQRLHNQTEFSGTGIGLASVKSIITNHGGTVWAEGATEKGATVYFTLPQSAQLRVVAQ